MMESFKNICISIMMIKLLCYHQMLIKLLITFLDFIAKDMMKWTIRWTEVGLVSSLSAA